MYFSVTTFTSILKLVVDFIKGSVNSLRMSEVRLVIYPKMASVQTEAYPPGINLSEHPPSAHAVINTGELAKTNLMASGVSSSNMFL